MPMYQAEALWILFMGGRHQYPMAVKEGRAPLDDGTSAEPKPEQIGRLGPKRHAIREGAF